MNLRYFKTTASLLLAFLIMIVIFMLSAQNSGESGSLSDSIARALASILIFDFHDLSAEEQLRIVEQWSWPVRKTAHATEFGCLALSWCASCWQISALRQERGRRSFRARAAPRRRSARRVRHHGRLRMHGRAASALHRRQSRPDRGRCRRCLGRSRGMRAVPPHHMRECSYDEEERGLALLRIELGNVLVDDLVEMILVHEVLGVARDHT